MPKTLAATSEPNYPSNSWNLSPPTPPPPFGLLQYGRDMRSMNAREIRVLEHGNRTVLVGHTPESGTFYSTAIVPRHKRRYSKINVERLSLFRDADWLITPCTFSLVPVCGINTWRYAYRFATYQVYLVPVFGVGCVPLYGGGQSRRSGTYSRPLAPNKIHSATNAASHTSCRAT